jgi:hypothetical protein
LRLQLPDGNLLDGFRFAQILLFVRNTATGRADELWIVDERFEFLYVEIARTTGESAHLLSMFFGGMLVNHYGLLRLRGKLSFIQPCNSQTVYS